jgi:hypothetical protein
MPGLYEQLFLKALCWTLLFEIPVVVAALRFSPWKTDLSWPSVLGAATLPTVLTLPYLWFVGPWLAPDPVVRELVGELSVALVESIPIALLSRIPWHRALAVSVAANALSWAAGRFLPLL